MQTRKRLPPGIVSHRRIPPAPKTESVVGKHNGIRSHQGAKLHIGCGKRRLAGWVNADAVTGVGDVVFDLHDELPYATYSEIYGSHVLEHCWPEDTPTILRRLHNALLPGGTLRLSVPDLRLVVKNCVDSNVYGDERSALSVLFGGTFSKTTSAPDLHRQAFWKERLSRLLMEAGFVNVREWGRGQYPAIDALKDFATHPCDLSTGKSTISLNMEADRPGKLGELPDNNSRIAAVNDAVIDVSVLLGTVNRPQMVRDCIEAVRKSVAGFSCEIVVAYGSEDDSALPWLRQQPDVVCVHGGMSGAIDAFNKAYAASRGRFICQLNDDVIVDGDSIARATRHLVSDASASGVIFKFDRKDGQGYRHERMAHTIHPNQIVVRREVCELVAERIGGFWGDENHRTDKTYGGDSAFGVICYHHGLRLDSVEGVTCQDLLAPDELRAQNKAAVGKQHGARWGALYGPLLTSTAPAPTVHEWPNCYIPQVGLSPRRSPIAAGRPLRTLFMPIVVKGWPQIAFREAFKQIGPFAEVAHEGGASQRMVEVARQHKPDLVFVQIQRDGWTDFGRVLRDAVGRDCTMVQWTGDVRTHAGQPVEPWIASLSSSFDLLLADNCTYAQKLAVQGIKAGYLSCGSEAELVWEPDAGETQGGAVFIGTNYSTLDGGERERFFLSIERELPGMVALYGNGWRGRNAYREISIAEAGRIMRRTPVTISKSYINNLDRYTSNRLKYALSAGAVAAVERFPDMEGLGLRHGVNCLVWTSVSDLVVLLRDWTRPEKMAERRAMRGEAHKLAAERFTWNRGVEELLAIVRDYRARRGQL